jgi:hypothetical protein
VPDPCQENGQPCSASGPLFGGLQGFSFVARPAQELELTGLHLGCIRGGPCEEPRGGGLFIPIDSLVCPPLYRRGDQIILEFCTDFYGIDNSYRAAQGVLMVGSSLREEEEHHLPNIIFGPVGPRDPKKPFIFGDALSFAYAPVSADIAFVTLGQFLFEPKDKLREIEIEVRGQDYRGESLVWDMGFGIRVTPPVSSGNAELPVFAWPAFGGVVRRILVPAIRLTGQIMRFTGAIRGAVSLVPDQPGAIRNLGNVPVLLITAVRGGPNADEFNFLIEYEGDVFTEDELAARGPLTLYPGQTLTIGGRFFPQADARPGHPPRTAWLDVTTNIPQYPSIRVLAEGNTVPQDARGTMLPSVINFGSLSVIPGNRPYGSSRRNVLVISDGSTPLLAQSPTLSSPIQSITVGIRDPGRRPDVLTPGAPYQIEPGGSLTIDIHFDPTTIGVIETNLMVETNAGRLETRIFGEGIA